MLFFEDDIFRIKGSFQSLWILGLFMTVSLSCQKEDKRVEINTYYNLRGFVEEQIKLLNSQKPTVSKTLITGDKSEKLTLKNVNWKKELELFVLADINKPAYSKSYSISRPDSLTFIYVLKNGETLPVQHLTITLDSNSRSPREVSAMLLTKNKLYESQKDILLQCAQRAGNWSVVSYEITGYQKLSVLEPKLFSVKGMVE